MFTWLRSIRCVLFVIAVLATGCTAAGPLYRPIEIIPPGQALVYVYRQPSFAFSAQSVNIRVDGETVAKLLNGGYTAMGLSPGDHTLTLYVGMFLSRLHQKVHMEAGQTYFFAMRARSFGLGVEWAFTPVGSKLAEQQIAELHYQAPIKYGIPESQKP